jgi:hypothetical protein
LPTSSIQALSSAPPGSAKGGFHLLAVFQSHDTPAAGGEDVVEAAEHPLRGGGVERLAIIVDDPPAIADVVLVGLDQAFVDIAFVELRIAHQRDHAPGLVGRHHAVRDQIILDEARKGGDRDPEADGAGGEIDRDLVLGPARIALHSAEAAEILELLAALGAEEIMDGVKHRPGMRLHRHLVVRPERVEIERGHDRRHRGA